MIITNEKKWPTLCFLWAGNGGDLVRVLSNCQSTLLLIE